MKIKSLYKNLGMAACLVLAISCSDDKLAEQEAFIPVNPNPEGGTLSKNEQWDWVGKFPGEVDNSVQRLADIEVVVNGDYSYNPGAQIAPAQKNLQSSGLYVPPAELVTVNATVPGLHYQIGIADIFIPSEGNKYTRFEDVTKHGELESGTNEISSNFGGHLYFYYEGEPVAGDVTVTVSNAVKSFDFVLGQTDPAQWLVDVADTDNPAMIWGELIGKKIILTLPLEVLRKIERPGNLIEFYDNLVSNDLEPHAGLTAESGINSRLDYPIRLYTDVQLPKDPSVTTTQTYGAFYFGGYPAAINMSVKDTALVEALINLDKLGSENDNYVMGALGDSYQMPWQTGKSFGGIASALPLYRYAHSKGVWPSPHVNFEDVPLKFTDDPTLKFINLPVNERLGMTMQLAMEYGWNIFGYMSQRTREVVTDSVKIDIVKNDLLAIFASEYANADLTQFFDDWQFPISSFAGSYINQFQPAADFWSIFNRKFGDMDTPMTGTQLTLGELPQRDTVYNRTEWVGNSSPIQSGTVASETRKGIDGDPSTIWHSKWENGKLTGGHYPHWVSYEFDELSFNYFYLQPRQGGAAWNTPRIFKIEVENEETGLWEPVENGKEFYLRKVNDLQYFYLKNTYVAKKVRLHMLTPQINHAANEVMDDDRQQLESVSFAEFGLGLVY